MKTILKYELVINKALRSALQYDTPDEQIQEFISFFGNHIGSDRIYIFEDNEKKNITTNTYEWCANGVTSEIDNLQSIDRDIIDWWYEAFDRGENIIIYDIETIREEHPEAYEILAGQDIHNLVTCPLRYKNEIKGLFGVDNPPKSDSLGLTTFLDMVGTLLIALMKVRNAFRKSSRAAKLSGYSVLSQIYISMNYINVQTHQFHVIKTPDEVTEFLKKEQEEDPFATIGETFKEHIEKIFRKFCSKEYMETELEFLNLDTVEERLKGKTSIVSEYYGNIYGWCRDRFIPIDYDADGNLLHVLCCIECIDEQKKREDELRYLAQVDLMTGIWNRGSGEAQMEQALKKKVSGMMCLIDCDKFKSINDTFGHSAGDDVIVAIADVLKKSCRENDIVMRLGGDEFAIFIPGMTERKNAEDFIERLFDNIKKIEIPKLGDGKIVISLGACFYDGVEEADFDKLYLRADNAMYESKRQEGFCATIYSEL